MLRFQSLNAAETASASTRPLAPSHPYPSSRRTRINVPGQHAQPSNTGQLRARTSRHIATAVRSSLESPVHSQANSGADPQLDAALLSCCNKLAKEWCGVKDDNKINTKQTLYSVKGVTGGRLAVTSLETVSAHNDSVQMVLTFALHYPDLKPSSALSSKQADVLLHWGCSKSSGDRWHPPPQGWHTSPPVSFDAGGGAWQTPFIFQADSQASSGAPPSFWVMQLQLPLQGPLRHGGLSFLLKTKAGLWIQDQSTHKDFFFSTSQSGAASTSTTSRPKVHQQSKSMAPAAAKPPAKEDKKPLTYKSMSQEERNRAELPDITKGVPWLPNEGPRMSEQLSQPDDFVPPDRSETPWYSEGIFGDVDEDEVKAFVKDAELSQYTPKGAELMQGVPEGADSHSDQGNNAGAVSKWMVDAIAAQEQHAERSLMHRFNTAQQLVQQAAEAKDAGAALTGILMWLRLSAARHLTWNRNYNVKPREISSAQDRLNTSLSEIFEKQPVLRQLVVPSMAAAGRGGSSDVGQRIRDEILAVQARNNCKGGMMEEWHQKLHNNTSPDDVVICQALIAMLEEDLDIRAYWRVLHASNITAQRLASFDRAIRNEPRFSPQQVPGLLADLRAYLQTLQSVHSGADLGAAAGSVLGFSQKSMKGKLVTVDPIPGAASPELRQLLLAVLYQQRQLGMDSAKASSANALSAAALMLQLVLQTRHLLRPIIQKGNAATSNRLRDILFLDMSLDSTARTTLEAVMSQIKAEANAWHHEPSAPGDTLVPVGLLRTMRVVALAVENAAVSSEQLCDHSVTEDLCKALKWLNGLCAASERPLKVENIERRDWAMQVVAVVDRLKRSLSDQGHKTVCRLQPTALALGEHLSVPKAAVCLMCEDAARGTSIAPVAQLLAAAEPSVRRLGGQGDWQVISRGKEQGAMQGKLRFEASLEAVQYETCDGPTVLLVDHISGFEELPEGVVVLLTSGDCPDVLSHSAVRARNTGVLMAACLSSEGFAAMKSLSNSNVVVSLAGAEVKVKKA